MNMKNPKPDKKRNGSEFAGAASASANTAAAQTHYDKFHASQAHGFAAEQANHLHDILTGKKASIVGGNNAKDGPDRLVNGIQIQTKYCQTASDTVAAAFRDGQYRYVSSDGMPMALEVPCDQYEKAVEIMARRIAQGHVPGVTDPQEAKEIVQKGSCTYNQARNIAKFGTIDSLTYDAIHGAIISVNVMGITAAISFARSVWNGDSADIAVENALYSGIQMGGVAFVSTVITAQLMRTSLSNTLIEPIDQVIKLLGPKVSGKLASLLKDSAGIYGESAMNSMSKILRGGLVASTVMLIVLSENDIRNAFRGRISGKQLFKNMSTAAGGLAGGTAGRAVGKFVGKYLIKLLPGGAGKAASLVITLASSAVGGTAGASATNKVVGHFVEDDAVEMVRIVENVFCGLAQEYMMTQEEVDIVIGHIERALGGETLLDMFSSGNRESFAEGVLRSEIERLLRGRCRVLMPDNAVLVRGISRLFEDAECGAGIFSARTEADPVEIGRELTGEELPKRTAQKALYTARQINLAQSQVERCLETMSTNERKHQEEMAHIQQGISSQKNDIWELLGGVSK